MRTFEQYLEALGEEGQPFLEKNWIQGAVNPAHKGYCTPMSKDTCTGGRKRFAELMKKKHGFHKKKD